MSENAVIQHLPEGLQNQATATVSQGIAARPGQSVWVSASAGSGKTRVLVNRLLRLLLPSPDGKQMGSPASKILCLTFTKAGAAEMALRVQKRLRDWVVSSDGDLEKDLRDLHEGKDVSPAMMVAARKLFADVLETPEGLKIMTIHSFCQSVLGRFPVEAGLPPYFTMMDESEAHDLLHNLLDQVLESLGSHPEHPFYRIFDLLLSNLSLQDLKVAIAKVLNEPLQLRDWMEKSGGTVQNGRALILNSFGLSPESDASALFAQACEDAAFPAQALRDAAANFKDNGPILHWLSLTPEDRVVQFDAYYDAFFTQAGKPRTTFIKFAEKDPVSGSVLLNEIARLSQLLETQAAIRQADYTSGLLLLASAVQEAYTAEKLQRGVLDYNDLILRTLALLQAGENAVAWVHYKLDEGLHHILVDEAQDTNPEQWEIIRFLCEEFFSGGDAHEDTDRSVFVVGDEKQSIYSFQRADLASFDRMRNHFQVRVTQARKIFEQVPLPVSFRTTPPVLLLTDLVFDTPADRLALGLPPDKPLRHFSSRATEAGHIELWPLISDEKKPRDDEWVLPLGGDDTRKAIVICASNIANAIQFWLQKGDVLPSTGKPVQAGDILILVQRRNALVGHLVKELKSRNIPVSGVDRMVLNDQLAVQDLLAVMQFALMPDDDFTLACVLKSPLIGISEDDLLALCLNRPGSLYERVKADPQWARAAAYLDDQIKGARDEDAFAFLQRVLSRPCPASADGSGLKAIVQRLGPDMIDPIEELLQQAMQEFSLSRDFGLQRFLQRQTQSDRDIKREMDQGRDEVRIMTVHASKGLEAPIVILPDTVSYPDKGKVDRMVWPDRTSLTVPLWAPDSSAQSPAFDQARSVLFAKAQQEYRRLLYVALTRAKDRLYVMGYKGVRPKEMPQDCWYSLIKNGFRQIAGHQEDADHKLIYSTQGNAKSVKARAQSATHPVTALPRWIADAAPEPPDPVRPLQPSKPSSPQPQMNSPVLMRADQHRFKRGLLTHTLFEILPELPIDRRENAALHYIAKHGTDLASEIRQEILREVMAILNDERFAPVFGPGSMAEVPITGMIPVDNRETSLVSGQIDRLVVLPDHILIVDFKTNRPSPRDAHDIPPLYIEQLRLYAAVLRAIYPNRLISCALLWTDQPLLMPVQI